MSITSTSSDNQSISVKHVAIVQEAGNRDFYILGNFFVESSIRSFMRTDQSAGNALRCRLAAAVRAAMLDLFNGPVSFAVNRLNERTHARSFFRRSGTDPKGNA